MTNTEKYTGNSVIERGYEIYDGWQDKKLPSREVVRSVEAAVATVKNRGTKEVLAEALSYLFALDLRIKERYNSLLHYIIYFFSRRREISARNFLCGTLNISEEYDDIRSVIEVELLKIREMLEESESDGDDETRGGKRNGKSEEDAATEEKGFEESEEEAIEETPDLEEEKEASEEKEEPTEELTEEKTAEENSPEEAEPTEEVEVTEEGEPVSEEDVETEEEAVKAEADTPATEEKTEGAKANDGIDVFYTDQVDFFDLSTKSGNSEKQSGAERPTLLDDILFHEKGNNPDSDKEVIREDRGEKGKVNNQKENSNGEKEAVAEGKEEYLRGTEKTAGDKGIQNAQKTAEGQQVQNAVNQTEGEEVQSPEQSTVQNVEPAENVTQSEAPKETREPVQVNMKIDHENMMRMKINENLSEESVLSYRDALEASMREHIKITLAGFGMDDNVEIVGRNEAPPQKKSPTNDLKKI